MTRIARTATFATVVSAALVLAPAAAHADPTAPSLPRTSAISRPAASCTGPVATEIKAKLHDAATRRQATLGELVTKLSASPDPFGLNPTQVSVLQDANSGITALDQTLQSTCYPTIAELRTAGAQLYEGYRVYWLRVPQTRQIEAAGRLGDLATKVADAAAKLDGRVGDNADAAAALASMHEQLAIATAQIGTPPVAAASITTTAGLLPAKDMTANVATMHTSLDALQAARAALAQARADGLKALQSLRG